MPSHEGFLAGWPAASEREVRSGCRRRNDVLCWAGPVNCGDPMRRGSPSGWSLPVSTERLMRYCA